MLMWSFRCLAVIFAGLTVAICIQPSYAVELFNDGQSHSVTSTLRSNIFVYNKTEVVVGLNAWIRATTSQSDFLAAEVIDTSTVSITGGTVSSTTSGPGDAVGIQSDGHSTISITGGEVSATTSNPGRSYGAILFGDSMLDMSGGSLRVTTNGAAAYGIIANDNATVRLSGGRLRTTAFNPPTEFDLTLNGTSQLLAFGNNFNYPTGIPISDLSGTISGNWSDGARFSYSFRRSPSATLILVPEPSAMLLSMLGVFLILIGGRRKLARRFTSAQDLSEHPSANN